MGISSFCHPYALSWRLLLLFVLAQMQPGVGWYESDLTLIAAFELDWNGTHCGGSIKDILKLNSPLFICFFTEATCCCIAPPGGYSVLCCYISISLLSIYFLFKCSVWFLFLSLDLDGDSFFHSIFINSIWFYAAHTVFLTLIFVSAWWSFSYPLVCPEDISSLLLSEVLSAVSDSDQLPFPSVSCLYRPSLNKCILLWSKCDFCSLT